NYEIGTALSFFDVAQPGDALQLKVTGFYNDITDLITDNGQSANPRYTNIGEATIYGAEIEAAYEADYVFASAYYSHVIGKDDITGLPLNNVAPHEFGFTVGGRLPDYDLTIGWSSRFVAAQNRVTGDPFERQPSESFNTHDIFLTWKPDEGPLYGWDANFRVDNIFDEDYQEFLSGTPGKGRTFKVSLSKQIGW